MGRASTRRSPYASRTRGAPNLRRRRHGQTGRLARNAAAGIFVGWITLASDWPVGILPGMKPNAAADALKEQISQHKASRANAARTVEIEDGIIAALEAALAAVLGGNQGENDDEDTSGRRRRASTEKVQERITAILELLAARGPQTPSQIAQHLMESEQGRNVPVTQVQDILRRNAPEVFDRVGDGRWKKAEVVAVRRTESVPATATTPKPGTPPPPPVAPPPLRPPVIARPPAPRAAPPPRTAEPDFDGQPWAPPDVDDTPF